ncbi:transmembrane protein 51a [Clupea harengus]|uniref:Transmembrane protein 51a n=1 Tax=Clupea harengus TaxID=7950 RepID=A0A6P8F2C5_CLUHA|nr:transmembrane protein 51a [Clupea harengus]
MSQSAGERGGAGGGGSNSGSQYALCALGVGLVALGIVMIVWSVVPVDSTNNSSRPGQDMQGKTSSVAFVLVGAGVTMLLLSLCLGVRNKRRREDAQTQGPQGTYNTQLSVEDTADVLEERFTVPSYEEVVGSAPYPAAAQACARNNSTTHLPSYEDVFEGGEHVVVVDAPLPPEQPLPGAAAAPTATTGGRWNGRAARKLLPLKIRRIKSEKLRAKSASSSPQPMAVFSIEPLTPPPQYDDKTPPL